jgi:hypothetical protein
VVGTALSANHMYAYHIVQGYSIWTMCQRNMRACERPFLHRYTFRGDAASLAVIVKKTLTSRDQAVDRTPCRVCASGTARTVRGFGCAVATVTLAHSSGLDPA